MQGFLGKKNMFTSKKIFFFFNFLSALELQIVEHKTTLVSLFAIFSSFFTIFLVSHNNNNMSTSVITAPNDRDGKAVFSSFAIISIDKFLTLVACKSVIISKYLKWCILHLVLYNITIISFFNSWNISQPRVFHYFLFHLYYIFGSFFPFYFSTHKLRCMNKYSKLCFGVWVRLMLLNILVCS